MRVCWLLYAEEREVHLIIAEEATFLGSVHMKKIKFCLFFRLYAVGFIHMSLFVITVIFINQLFPVSFLMLNTIL